MAFTGFALTAGAGELTMLGIGRHGPTGPQRMSLDSPAADGPDGHASDRLRVVQTGGAGRRPADRDMLAVLAAVDGVGPLTLERLLARFGTPHDIFEVARTRAGTAALKAASAGPSGARSSMTQAAALALVAAAANPDAVLKGMRAAGVHPLVIGDPAYPARLRMIELPPRVLFVRGSDEALGGRTSIAVVGTRQPTDLGRRTAARIGAALARAGALVVSGLAIGIDGATHQAVVEEAGTTVAVIGGGHGRLSPASHDRLADAIVDAGGAVISEHGPGVVPSRGTFPRRNRVISGLADAVVVIEAGARSGALLTAAWALEQGRECFLVPGSIEAPQSAGCLAWLRDYAGVARVVAGVPQLLEDLGLAAAAAYPVPEGRTRQHGTLVPPERPSRQPSIEAVALEFPEREGSLLRALAGGASTVDEAAAVTGLPIGAILGGLTVLEDRGLIDGTYGRYRIRDLRTP